MDRTKNPNSTIDERVNRSRKIFKEIGYPGIDLNTDEFYKNTATLSKEGVMMILVLEDNLLQS
jgi:purine-nucleoside phosphorylase